ncbi:hypothetical protein JTB14_025535 [Gonioctena quinquepunctata]|nr:hypothetical protein JTB14_025535 [Gonioctena quinquepunctata]
MPLLYVTSLGWVVSGQLGIGEATNVCCHLNVNQELLNAISKFWEVEELPESEKLSEIEQFCETNFTNTTTRDAKGRFVVTMPLKQNPTNIGDSRSQAEKRFYTLERKFRKDHQFQKRYKEFMAEYRDLLHMNLSDNKNDTCEYFMPHHGVTKEDSLTTKLSVVFDAWAPSSNADIAKMYRKVLITPAQRHLQKIFWRDDPNDELDKYALNTVTYGQTSIPAPSVNESAFLESLGNGLYSQMEDKPRCFDRRFSSVDKRRTYSAYTVDPWKNMRASYGPRRSIQSRIN